MQLLVHVVHLAEQAATENKTYNEKIRWRLNPRLAIHYTLGDVQTMVS